MSFIRYLFLIVICFWLFVVSVPAAKRPPWNGDGRYRKAFVVEGGLSALRRSPSTSSVCLRRLRLGRSVYVISTHRGKDGIDYYFVAVTRRTRGYVDSAAVASPSRRGDDARLMRLIEEADGIDQITLCRLLITQFSSSRFCPEALLVEGMAAEGVAQELSRRVARRPPKQLDKELTQDRYLFNYSGLDRYSRLGLYFRVIDESFHYDGAAYRRILKSYPRSQAAQTASERLEEIEEENHKGTKITKIR